MIWFLLLYATAHWQASMSVTLTKPCYACRHGNNATKIACLWTHTHTHTTCKATISHCSFHVAITYHAGLASVCGTFIGLVGPDIQYRSQKAARSVLCRRLLPPCTGTYFRISSCFVIQSACSCSKVLSMKWNTKTAYFSRISVDDFAINYSRGYCSVLIICHAETSSDFYRWLLYNKIYCKRREHDKSGRNLHSGHVTYTDLCSCSYFGHTAHLRAICFFPQKN